MGRLRAKTYDYFHFVSICPADMLRAMTMKKHPVPRIAIVGAGKLGAALAFSLRGGYSISELFPAIVKAPGESDGPGTAGARNSDERFRVCLSAIWSGFAFLMGRSRGAPVCHSRTGQERSHCTQRALTSDELSALGKEGRVLPRCIR